MAVEDEEEWAPGPSHAGAKHQARGGKAGKTKGKGKEAATGSKAKKKRKESDEVQGDALMPSVEETEEEKIERERVSVHDSHSFLDCVLIEIPAQS